MSSVASVHIIFYSLCDSRTGHEEVGTTREGAAYIGAAAEYGVVVVVRGV